MKRLLIASFVLFAAGFALKLFHVHYNALIMLTAIIMMLCANLGSAAMRLRINILPALATTSWMLLLLCTVKFYPFTKIVFILSILLTLVALLPVLRKQRFLKLVPLSAAMAVALFFHFMPAHKKYHLFNIRYNYEIETDYFSWDKYSWFLYQNGQFEDAAEASGHALEIARKQGDQEMISQIREHRRSIRKRNWQRFH